MKTYWEEHPEIVKIFDDLDSYRYFCQTYGFTFDEIVADDDTSVEKDGVTALVDPMSYQYLAGAQVDYIEGLEGSRFVVTNPNADTTCGCGSSFSV